MPLSEAEPCSKYITSKIIDSVWDQQAEQSDSARELEALLPPVLDRAFEREL